MQIPTKSILNKMDYSLSGTEIWLETLYSTFPTPGSSKKQHLTASLSIIPLDFDRFSLKGHFKYQPYLTCSRCNKSMSFPIDQDFAVTFHQERRIDQNQEGDWSHSHLDEYFVENDLIDIEVFLNEQVQLAVPDYPHCSNCPVPNEDRLIYGQGNQLNRSAFSSLQSLLEGQH